MKLRSGWRDCCGRTVKVYESEEGACATPALGTAATQHMFNKQINIHPEESSMLTLEG